jgi:hypothetical protein
VAALAVSLWRGTPDGRLAVRLLAATALARRLTVNDLEFAAFVVVAIGAALLARRPGPATRRGLAWLAAAILLFRTAAFHAMGQTESFSTVDIAGGFAGMSAGNGGQAGAAGGATPEVVEAALQLALRFLLPWLVLLAAAARALGDARRLRALVADLAISYAARGAAIAIGIWVLWRSAWWFSNAYPVFALGAGDLVLLTAAALLVGAWGPAAGADRPSSSHEDSSSRRARRPARYLPPPQAPSPPSEAPQDFSPSPGGFSPGGGASVDS